MTDNLIGKETCQRIINKTICGKPKEISFAEKNHKGHLIHYVLCKKHSADMGVRKIK